MSYSVHVNQSTRTVTLICWGAITANDLMEYERLYWGGKEHEGYHHVVDLQLADLRMTLEESLMLATHATPTDLEAYQGARSAMVVGNEEQQYLVEAFRDARHTMCHPKTREVAVFDDIEVAKTWIEESTLIIAK